MINKLFKNRFFLVGIQFLTLIVFVMLIYGAIGITTNDAAFAKILRNTNLPNLIVWSYWWPFIIVTAIFFGRFWCSICPMELITSFFGKIGLRRKPTGFLKSGWLITLFYAIILILGIHTLAIHRIPQYMALYMLGLFAVAVVVGFIWEKRTFCTYVCPIGNLLGLYSMLSFKKLSVKNKEMCASCKTKDCISKENHYKFVGRSCTSELFPEKLIDNRACILCGQCIKSCTKDNIAIQKQRMASDVFASIVLSWAEIAFFVMLSGFVVYEILSEWTVSKEILMRIPDFISKSLSVSGNYKGTIKALSLFIFTPFLFYLILASIKKTIAGESWKKASTQLSLVILPITASMHLLKALFKTTSRIPYWEYAITDPEGVSSAELIIQNPDLLNNTILNSLSALIGITALILSITGLLLSFYVIKMQDHKGKLSRIISLVAVLLYWSVFLGTIISKINL